MHLAIARRRCSSSPWQEISAAQSRASAASLSTRQISTVFCLDREKSFGKLTRITEPASWPPRSTEVSPTCSTCPPYVLGDAFVSLKSIPADDTGAPLRKSVVSEKL